MYCIIWTYKVPPRLTKEVIEKQFTDVADRYIAVPGLIRKYFCYSEDGTSVAGIYLWTSRESANKFYSPEWMSGVKERWGAEPTKNEWLVPVVAESRDGIVITG